MKRLLFISLAALFSFQAFSQDEITYQHHALKAGDYHPFIITNNVEEGPAGENQVWDFSGLTYVKELTSKMLKASETVRGTDLPLANVVIEEWGNKFYFNVKEDVIEHVGTVTSDNKTLTKYDVPYIKMAFPFQYGDVYENEISGTQESNGNVTPISGKNKIEVDGYGTVILPGGIQIDDVVRLKEVREQTYTCGFLTTITYRWYCKEVRYPLVSIIKRQAAQQSNIIRTAYYADAYLIKQDKDGGEHKELKGTEDLSSDNEITNDDINLSISPNPYQDEFKINFNIERNSEIKIVIIDSKASQVFSKDLGVVNYGNHELTINAKKEGMVAGIYFVKVYINGNYYSVKVVQNQ